MADKELEGWDEYARQKKSDDKETAKILKEALTIVDKLAKMDIDDIIVIYIGEDLSEINLLKKISDNEFRSTSLSK